MKILTKKIFSQAMAAVLALSFLITPALATNSKAEQFQDVSEDHAYYDTILEARREGVVSGDNGISFRPDDAVSIVEFITMYTGLFAPDASPTPPYENGWLDTAYQAGGDLGLVSQDEASQHAAIDCTWTTMVMRLLNVSGLSDWPAQLWGDEEIDGLTDRQQDAIVSAQHYGLLDGIEIEDYTGVMTRAEALQLLYNLQSSNDLDSLPELVQTMAISFEEETVSNENQIYQSLLILPEEYIELWAESGWSMHVISGPICETREEYSMHTAAVGICSYKNKEILIQGTYSACSLTALHEFGHFISRMKGCRLPDSIFNAEKDALSLFLRPYAASSASEAFADVFRYCVRCHDNEKQMDALKEALPLCYEFFRAELPEIWD